MVQTSENQEDGRMQLGGGQLRQILEARMDGQWCRSWVRKGGSWAQVAQRLKCEWWPEMSTRRMWPKGRFLPAKSPQGPPASQVPATCVSLGVTVWSSQSPGRIKNFQWKLYSWKLYSGLSCFSLEVVSWWRGSKQLQPYDRGFSVKGKTEWAGFVDHAWHWLGPQDKHPHLVPPSFSSPTPCSNSPHLNI